MLGAPRQSRRSIDPRPWIFLGLALLAGAAPTSESTVAIKKWLEGPIRYIITPAEEKEFKRLREDVDRAAFVERFWLKRDPTPDTWVNEYRVLFWNRVREANEKFTDSAFPGWKTDRGKIYVLHGAPQDIQEDLNADVSGSGGSRGLIRWTYQGRPGGRPDLDPVIVVPFVRDATGEYRLSYDPALSSVFFDWSSLTDRKSPSAWDRWSARYPTMNKSPLSVMLDLGKMQEIPPIEQVLLERVETYETFAQTDLAVDLAFFEPPGKDGALLIATIALAPGPAPEGEVVVLRLTPREGGGSPRVLSEGSFTIKPEGKRRLAQGRLMLAPGVWDAFAVVVDPDTGVNRVWRGAVTIAPRTPGLRASAIVVAAELEPVPYASLVTYDVAYTVGAFRLTPLAGRALTRGEEIKTFLEVYGGTPPYKATFRLEGKESDGRWTALGKPQPFEGPGPAIAWGLPTSASWPTGDYRVTAEIEDSAGNRINRDATLTLAEAGKP